MHKLFYILVLTTLISASVIDDVVSEPDPGPGWGQQHGWGGGGGHQNNYHHQQNNFRGSGTGNWGHGGHNGNRHSWGNQNNNNNYFNNNYNDNFNNNRHSNLKNVYLIDASQLGNSNGHSNNGFLNGNNGNQNQYQSFYNKYRDRTAFQPLSVAQPSPSPEPESLPEPEVQPSVSFTHTLPSGSSGAVLGCPRPKMGDRSKFELRCILPSEDNDRDCYDLGMDLPSGTTVILKCRLPYVNEKKEVRIWVCEDGTWKGEFRSIVCIQEGYSFNFKNQTSGSSGKNQNNLNKTQGWRPTSQEPKSKPKPNKPSTGTGSSNKIVNNLFPNLIDETSGPTQPVVPSEFPAWTQREPVRELQPPWQATFDRWEQESGSGTTTTTTRRPPETTTTRRPPQTTTARKPRPPTTGWTTTTTTTTKAPTTTQKPKDWLPYLNENDIKTNTTPICPPLRKRTGIQLECLSKTPVSGQGQDSSSFLVSQSDCSANQVRGTEATYKCLPYYESSAGLTLQYRKCKEDGTWTGGDLGFACALECGKSNLVGQVPLITNGEPSFKSQWPWHAALFFRLEEEEGGGVKYEYNCGATLISRRSVLTAAHCVTKFFSTKLRDLGSFRIDLGRFQRTEEDEYVQTFEVMDVILHPSYNPDSFDSDIAIVILRTEVTIGFHVRPICYPQTQNSAFEARHLADGSIGTVVGFGKNESGALADTLQMARLKVIGPQECAASFTDTNYGTSLTKSTTFCAAGLKKGTNVCSGDSGSGIYFPLNTVGGSSRWYLQGIVSVGIESQDGSKQCDPERFSVFTRVSPYADWIVRVLSEKEAL